MMEFSNQLALISSARATPPVPVFTLAKQLGLGCEPRPLEHGISGMLEKVSEGQYRLYYNENHPETRKRFTVAHEIGHFILHRALLGDGVDDDTAYRSTMKGNIRIWRLVLAKRHRRINLQPIFSCQKS